MIDMRTNSCTYKNQWWKTKTMRTRGETKNQRMARVSRVAINSIISDLEFTVEYQEGFYREQLYTLLYGRQEILP